MAASRADAIIKRLDGVLNRVNPTERLVYKRKIARTGGDPLIGVSGTVTTTDTLLSPPPTYQRLGRNVVGDHASAEMLLSGATTSQIRDDYSILLSPSCFLESELQDADVQIVFKSSDGKEEAFRITDYEPTFAFGKSVFFLAYIRSQKRQA